MQLSNSELLWLVPAGTSLLPPCKWSAYLQHLAMNARWVGESSCLSLTCALPSNLQKYMEDFREGGGICYEKWHSSVLGRISSGLTAVRRGGQMCTLHLSVPLGTAGGKYHADCQPRAVIFMCASLRALVMYCSANLPLSAG